MLSVKRIYPSFLSAGEGKGVSALSCSLFAEAPERKLAAEVRTPRPESGSMPHQWTHFTSLVSIKVLCHMLLYKNHPKAHPQGLPYKVGVKMKWNMLTGYFANRSLLVLVTHLTRTKQGWQQKEPIASPNPLRFKVFSGFSSAIPFWQGLLNTAMASEKEKKKKKLSKCQHFTVVSPIWVIDWWGIRWLHSKYRSIKPIVLSPLSPVH